MWHVWERREIRIGFWWRNQMERANLEDFDDVYGKIVFK
jgi:hypothetical protein